jgi:hypothetical protein
MWSYMSVINPHRGSLVGGATYTYTYAETNYAALQARA